MIKVPRIDLDVTSRNSWRLKGTCSLAAWNFLYSRFFMSIFTVITPSTESVQAFWLACILQYFWWRLYFIHLLNKDLFMSVHGMKWEIGRQNSLSKNFIVLMNLWSVSGEQDRSSIWCFTMCWPVFPNSWKWCWWSYGTDWRTKGNASAYLLHRGLWRGCWSGVIISKIQGGKCWPYNGRDLCLQKSLLAERQWHFWSTW